MGILKSKMVTIRKPRKCFGCLDMLKVGDIASVTTSVDMGQICDYTLCDECQDYVNDNLDSDDSFSEGDLREFRELP